MAKSNYPDELCMVGREDTYADEINGKFTRMKEAKKTDVRLFYEKGDGVVLCYGAKAWEKDEGAEKREKPIKGWMIGWFHDEAAAAAEGKEKDLFIAARCPIADPNSSEFKWEVRSLEGDFVEDPNTQLVLTGEVQKQAAPVKLNLANEVNLYPGAGETPKAGDELAASPTANPYAAGMPMHPYAAMGGMSPFGVAGFPGFPGFYPPGADAWGAQKKGKKKKGRGSASPTGLRAEAPAFVPGAAAAGYPMPSPAAMQGMFPFGVPFGMPGMPGGPPAAPDLARIGHRASGGQQAVNTSKYSAAEDAKPAEPPKPVQKKGLTATDTKVSWQLTVSKDDVLKCRPDKREDAVKSPSFRFTKDGTTGPEMFLTLYPFGHPLSSPGFISLMLHTEEVKEVKLRFQFYAGSKCSNAKVLMGNKFHTDFSRSAVFKVEEGGDNEALQFDEGMELGVELLAWM